jgi:excisionase family DNA binding protein
MKRTTSKAAIAPQWFSLTEAAQWLGRSPSYIRKLIKNGQGPKFARLGRSPCFALKDLQEFMESKMEGPK